MLSTLLMTSWALAADPNTAHPHQGVVPAYQGAPPAIELSPAEIQTLEQGSSVRKQLRYEGGGRGVSVMYVKSSPEKIWQVITNFSAYPQWVDKLDSTEVYGQTPSTRDVYFKLSSFGIGVEYYIHHVIGSDYMTWTLDYSRKSDLDDSVGFWRVSQLQTDPPLCRVDYSVDLRVGSWVPGFVEDLLVNKGLDMATSWVKAQAE